MRSSISVLSYRHKDTEQNLCADKGYTGDPAKKIIEAHGYITHVKERGEEIKAKKEMPVYRARRWVVELTHSWINRFRKLLVRYEKLSGSYIALIQMAFSIICWRKIKKTKVDDLVKSRKMTLFENSHLIITASYRAAFGKI